MMMIMLMSQASSLTLTSRENDDHVPPPQASEPCDLRLTDWSSRDVRERERILGIHHYFTSE